MQAGRFDVVLALLDFLVTEGGVITPDICSIIIKGAAIVGDADVSMVLHSARWLALLWFSLPTMIIVLVCVVGDFPLPYLLRLWMLNSNRFRSARSTGIANGPSRGWCISLFCVL